MYLHSWRIAPCEVLAGFDTRHDTPPFKSRHHPNSRIAPKHAKAAPFKRNDAMLEVLPVGVLVFPGNGIQENLADKAKKLGIPVLKFEKGA
ncbi:hypothetical protein [Pseudotabrizicola sp.]|uniref:hypothetical protein n=1 Tax=Pseudotabrizicola sp. TaxID=2939647 RepID=UPI0027266309|nr:hypothetical protein [Pseudotabrizicola sp.]MDO8884462.1 hypothetical protein [Pseudotabrizicola sp.]